MSGAGILSVVSVDSLWRLARLLAAAVGFSKTSLGSYTRASWFTGSSSTSHAPPFITPVSVWMQARRHSAVPGLGLGCVATAVAAAQLWRMGRVQLPLLRVVTERAAAVARRSPHATVRWRGLLAPVAEGIPLITRLL